MAMATKAVSLKRLAKNASLTLRGKGRQLHRQNPASSGFSVSDTRMKTKIMNLSQLLSLPRSDLSQLFQSANGAFVNSKKKSHT